jgi:outer membrane protein assembly factor BamB
VHIRVVCPFCLGCYQLDPGLLGQRIYCPNSSCREIFEVREEDEARTIPPVDAPPAPAPLPPKPVNEVPLLPTERAAPSRSKRRQTEPAVTSSGPREVSDWHQAPPPPRRNRSTPPPPGSNESGTGPVLEEEEPVQALVFDGDEAAPQPERNVAEQAPPEDWAPPSWEPPPVRHDPPPEAAAEPAHDAAEVPVHAPKARKAFRLVLFFMLVGMAILGGVGWMVWDEFRNREGRLDEEAMALVKEGRTSDALPKFQLLCSEFPNSEQIDEYQFFSEYCDLHVFLTPSTGQDAREGMNRLEQFLSKHDTNPLLTELRPRLGQALVRLLEQVAEARIAADNEARIAEVQPALLPKGLAERLNVAPAEVGRLNAAFDKALKAVADARLHDALIAKLKALPPTAESIRDGQRDIRQLARKLPGLEQDPEVVATLKQLFAGHRQQIVFTTVGAKGHDWRPAPGETSLVVDPLLKPAKARDLEPVPGPNRVVTSVARGILYGQSQSTGQVLWALRVGVDNTVAPVRLEDPTKRLPERFLVVADDGAALAVLRASNGEVLWGVLLDAPCHAQPLVMGEHAYVVAENNQVQQFDLTDGRLLGFYDLGQHLSVGGTVIDGTPFVFFPAADTCVYVLDVDKKACAEILYSDHPSGSIRSEARVLKNDDPEVAGAGGPGGVPPGYLVLELANRLDGTQWRTYKLPLDGPRSAPVELSPEPRLRGWSWFPTHQDPDKLVQVTDAGQVGMFGINQPGNQDRPLFPLLGKDGLVDLPAPRSRGVGSPVRSRSQLAYVQNDDLWILDREHLQRWHWTPLPPRLTPSPYWIHKDNPLSLYLGTPLQSAETDPSGNTLFLTTQNTGGQVCLATAVAADEGRVRWQRQLGLLCQGEPLPLGSTLLTLDRGFGLFAFDAAKHPVTPEMDWQIVDGNCLVKSQPETALGAAYLVRDADTETACAVASVSQGGTFLIALYQGTPDGKPGTVQEYRVDLGEGKGAALAGTPALRGKTLLLPLQDRSLWRVELLADGKTNASTTGIDWCAGAYQPGVQGHVVWLNDNEFITTNGGSGLNRRRRSEDGKNTFNAVPFGSDSTHPALQVSPRITAAPVLLQPGNAGGPASLFVADDGGRLSQIHVNGDVMQLAREPWNLNGKITAGPYLQGRQVCCVVDHRHLVWLDPAANTQWLYTTPGTGIVGRPGLVDGMVVLADEAGLFIGLDPNTGQPLGAGKRLRTAMPTASPAPFGTGRAFAPLSDGTILLLALEALRKPVP